MADDEYRVVYLRNGREQTLRGFPTCNIRWGDYFHDIRAHEVVRWEKLVPVRERWERVDG